MKPKWLSGSLLLLGLVVSGASTFSYPTYRTGVGRVRHSNPAGLELNLAAPPFTLVERRDAGRTFLSLEADGLSGGSPPGQPQLPTDGELVVVPPGSEVRWDLSRVEVDSIRLDYPLLPAPTPVQAEPDLRQQSGGGVRYVPDPDIYDFDRLYPAGWVTWGAPARLRGVDLAPLTVSPFRYNPARNELHILRRATLVISFVPSAQTGPGPTYPPPAEPFASVLSAATLNFPNVVADRRESSASGLSTSPLPTWNPGSNAYRVIVDGDGLYRLTYDELAAAGLPLGGGPGHLNPQTFRLMSRGQELALWVTGQGDQRFDPGDEIRWNPVPAYVLLVGDGTLDFHDYTGAGSETFIPPFLAPVDSFWGETASDNLYATVDGPDPLADFFIGRLPVNTPLEVTTVVNKIIAYEIAPAEGLWSGQMLFVADNPDQAGDFYAASDAVYNQVIPPFLGQKVYLRQGYAGALAAKSAILSAWNRGLGLVVFNGHSSWHQWAVEDLLHFNDVTALANGGRLPLVLGMTCFTGYFHHPQYGTLDEALVRQAGGGAVAAFSATGLGVATGHDWLFQGFFEAVVDDSITDLGPATAAAKLNLYSGSMSTVDKELLNTFLVLGDPALRLQLQPLDLGERVYLPIIRR
jgi:hypothetical protein